MIRKGGDQAHSKTDDLEQKQPKPDSLVKDPNNVDIAKEAAITNERSIDYKAVIAKKAAFAKQAAIAMRTIAKQAFIAKKSAVSKKSSIVKRAGKKRCHSWRDWLGISNIWVGSQEIIL
jgi:UDP-3-O-[3-hydroxymyristoyl] glucosamine N-acyltransferase